MSSELKKKNSWGGARKGAGRPKSSEMISHLKRPAVGNKRPVKITLKLRSGFPNIRDPEFLKVFEKATSRARRFGLRIIHYALLPSHIYLLVEMKNQEELEKSFKSLNTALAIFLKKWKFEKKQETHKGPVFLGRFVMELLDSPEAVKNCMKEILLMGSQHLKQNYQPDSFSSASTFQSWKALLGPDWNESFEGSYSEEEKQQALRITATPQFWLNQAGWKQSS